MTRFAISLFASLDSQALRQITQITEEVVCPAGSRIFETGEPGDWKWTTNPRSGLS